MSRGPTMQTIADAVGCSRMTVSLALRNSPDIATKTREKIQKAARELGYVPNPLVSTLMSQRAGKKDEGGRVPLALINTFEDFSAFKRIEFYNEALKGMQKRAAELGFYGEVFHLNQASGLNARQLDRILLNRGIRGVIIMPLGQPDFDFTLSWEHYSVTAIAHTWHGAPIHRSGPDLFGNASLLMETLFRLSFRRPGLLLHHEVHTRTRGIEAGAYYLYQNEHPELAKIPLLLRNDTSPISEIEQWVQKYQPDIVIGHGDQTRYLTQLPVALQRKLSYAELNLMPSQMKRLGGICPRPNIVGEQAVELVVSHLHRNEFGLPEHPRMTMVSGTWYDGESIRHQPSDSSTA